MRTVRAPPSAHHAGHWGRLQFTAANRERPPGVRHQPKEVEAIFPQACRLAEALRPAEESRITAPVSAGETTAPPTRPRSVQGLEEEQAERHVPLCTVLSVNSISVMLMILQIKVQTKLGLEILRKED
ncbi:hypothetical protein Q7C36_016335 [Tachysurus vachellii]|uniref:Uncharacterized protein n=1 Tax=Tachysurus vachellii TaxID=175792 RepID=A0AA88M665_TACVA|nr:hypothetical protein Q7C36_016335 [Tachysurus vachellii]